MKHFERHTRNTLNRNLYLIVIGLVLLIIFIFTIGIKALLGTAVFVSQLTKRNQPDLLSTKKDDFFGNIEITDIPTATNSSQIIVAGRVDNFDTIDFILNGNKVEQIDVIDSFEEEIGDLIEGNNEIYLLAKSKTSNKTKKTIKYQVFRISQKPNLEILEPIDNSKTTKEEIMINGKTDKEVIVEVNSLPIVVNPLGEFQTSVKLQSGENTILITAQDIAGNVETKQIKVIFEKD